MTNFNELYYQRPYDTEFDGVVVLCEPCRDLYRVVLNQTLFYPEGGGQPCDTGDLNGIEVKDVQEEDGRVVHYLSEAIAAGEKVHGHICWDRRFDFMQNHSGEHIVSGLIHKHFGYENVGFHMGDVITIDFDGVLNEEQMRQIEMEANETIYRNVEIRSVFPDEETLEKKEYRSKKKLTGTVRLIEIPDTDCCACCGTHVRFTGEIGMIKLLSCRKHKKGVRIEMISGRRALLYTNEVYRQNNRISVALSAEPLKTYDSVQILQKQLLDKNHAYIDLTEKMFQTKLSMFAENQAVLMDFEESIDRNAMRKMATEMADQKEPGVAAVFAKEEDGFAYVILSRKIDLSDHRNVLNERLNGRGGGTKEMLQGTFHAAREEIEKIFCELFK